MAMADYDRDGFLDLYLCVYSYFYGAGEDKAGTPMPYYDARNGPPSVLFRNDGHGRFVDVTREADSTRATTATTSPRPGPTTTATGGPTSWWPTTSARRTCTATRARDGKGDVRGRRRRAGVARLRAGHERGVPRLRQRRPPRHLHRQHVERGRAARDGVGRVHARRAAGGARALPPPCARQLALPQPRRRHASRT